MGRFVTVKYLTPVFVDVDLDAEPDADGYYPEGSVTHVQHGDSEVHRVDQDLAAWLKFVGVDDPIGDSYSWDNDFDAAAMTQEERQKALDIADNSIWPAWEGY